jgi:rod shape-determining protein MreB
MSFVEKVRRAATPAIQRLRLSLTGELAVDLGTSNTRVYAVGNGAVLNEPSVIAFSTRSGRVVAVGREAKLMIGREPRLIRVAQPLRNGVIADFEAVEKMLSHFIHHALTKWAILHPRLLLCIPGEITQVERRAFEDAALRAGTRQVSFVEEPFAAAAGVGLAVEAAHASMIVDIGGGTVDIAVLSLGGLIHASTLRMGGIEMDRAIARYLHEERGLEVGEQTAEAIKLKLGSADLQADERVMEVRGRSLTTRLPTKIRLRSAEVQTAIEPVVQEVMRTVRAALEELPPEVSADLLDSGIVLTGGGAQLQGLAERIGRESSLEVKVAANPQCAVVFGAGRLLQPEISVTELRPVEQPATSVVPAVDSDRVEAGAGHQNSHILAAPHG